MIKVFKLPDLGEGLTESEIVAWRVAPGDTVTLNQLIAEVDAVVIAAGWGLAALAPDLRLTPARGQASMVQGIGASPAAWGGYVVPTRDGLLFGATFDRGETTCEGRPADDAREDSEAAVLIVEVGRIIGQVKEELRSGTIRISRLLRHCERARQI